MKAKVGARFDYPIFASAALAAHTVVAIEAGGFVSAFSPIPEFQVSDQTTLHMSDPALPLVYGDGVLANPLRSGWQTMTSAVKMILRCSWAMRVATHVQYYRRRVVIVVDDELRCEIRDAIAQADRTNADCDYFLEKLAQRQQQSDGPELIYKRFDNLPLEHIDSATAAAAQPTMTPDQQKPWDDWCKAIARDEAMIVADALAGIIGQETGSKIHKAMNTDLRQWVRQQVAFSVFETVKRQLTERSAALEQRITALEQRGLGEDLKAELARLRDDLIRHDGDDSVVPMLKLKGGRNAA